MNTNQLREVAAAATPGPCMWCGKPSTCFCDAVIGFGATGCNRDKSGNVLNLLSGLDAEQWTCDAPMCDDHAKQVGWVCGEESDSIDHCPHHAQHPELCIDKLVMFASEADSTRRDIYASVRRNRMRAAIKALEE